MPESSFTEVAGRARAAALRLAVATRATKDAALHAMADALLAAHPAGGVDIPALLAHAELR